MLSELEAGLGYTFRDKSILENALTHSSYANENRERGLRDNERLEFLGDSILGFVVADYLYRSFPDRPEGELTRIRADLVCEKNLARAAGTISLGSFLLLGHGEEHGGGRKRDSIVSDAMESVIAASYMDGGFSAAFIASTVVCCNSPTVVCAACVTWPIAALMFASLLFWPILAVAHAPARPMAAMAAFARMSRPTFTSSRMMGSVLESFPPGTFDAVITDPPYASGGRTQAEKSKATAKKYSSMGGNAPPDFDGDAKDQRSWTRWAAEWLYLARRAAKPGAPVCMFIDWRQLPCASDALQWAGWIWRGIAVWDKGNSRPQKGRFRQQAEYIVWGSNGDMPVSRPVPCLPGVFKYGNPQNRIHLTEKPLQLMQDLVKITEPGGHILDPFAGSGTTVLAAVKEGYDATGIEVTDVYADLARKRLESELNAA